MVRQDMLIDSLNCTKYLVSHLDKSVLMDDVRRTLGAFFALNTLSLLTVVAVHMQQVASNMNKLTRAFDPDLRL